MAEETILERPACQNCPRVVVDGEDVWEHYIIDYWFKGKYWSVTVYARSWEEAEERAKAMRPRQGGRTDLRLHPGQRDHFAAHQAGHGCVVLTPQQGFSYQGLNCSDDRRT